MLVLNKAEFLKMPPGILFAKGVQWNFKSLCVKGETTDLGDFWYLNPCWIQPYEGDSLDKVFDRLNAMLVNGQSAPMENAETRDGDPTKDAIFLVFERSDLIELKHMIDGALKVMAS